MPDDGSSDPLDHSDPLWDYTEHTRAKHEILDRYLGAWLSILSTNPNNQLMLVDGFAGRGEYNDGQKGSPVRMFERAASVLDEGKARRVVIRCAEVNATNHAGLCSVTADLRHEKIDFAAHLTTFEELGGRVADLLDEQQWATFVLVDPYGFAGVPLELIERLLAHDRVEVLLTFMVESMSRFLREPGTDAALTSFFGGQTFRSCDDAPDRSECLLLRYREVVVPSIARFATAFRVFRDARANVLYYLVHLTNYPLGMRRMKEAMVRQSEDLTFWPLTLRPPDQIALDLAENEPYPTLQEHLAGTFAGRRLAYVELLNEDYPEGAWVQPHYRAALQQMERDDRVTIKRLNPRTPTGKPKRRIDESDEVVFP